MFSKDKLIIRTNNLRKSFIFHLFFWLVSFWFFSFLTGENQFFSMQTELLNVSILYYSLVVLSLTSALLYSLIDMLFGDRMMRLFPVQIMIVLKGALYSLSVVVVMILATQPQQVLNPNQYIEWVRFLPERDIQFWRFLSFFVMAAFLNSFLKGMIKKVGRGNFQSWIFGVLNKPREEERIFMFIDLKSSTTIAEKMGHKKFSHLVQDVFNDLAIVDNYKGEIYSYLGDGAIITWNIKDGLQRHNFLKSFYAVSKVLKRRDRYYNRKYDLSPQFKAGVHVGKVMVLQVGQIRRDISYNGDTMNTAARIESKCNELKSNLLISGDLYNLLGDTKEFRFKNIGNIALRGKKQGVDIIQVKEKTVSKAKKK